MTTLHDPAVDAQQVPLPASLPAAVGAVERAAVVAASPAPTEPECEHTWGWHTEDGCGRPITPGVYCDECAERHPNDDEFATRRHWERAGI